MAETTDQLQRPRRRVPRWVWFVVVCVALGAMTSVGVAWCAVYRNYSGFSALYRLTLGLWDDLDENEPTSSLLVNVYQLKTLTQHWFISLKSGPLQTDPIGTLAKRYNDAASQAAMVRHRPLLQSVDGRFVEFKVDLAGWPFRCLASERACDADSAKLWKGMHPIDPSSVRYPSATLIRQNTSVDPVFKLRTHYHAIEMGEHLFPTFPLWPGLLANTAFYGGAWAVLIGVPVLLRRWLRARKGGCAGCGYSREGLKDGAPCPECGRECLKGAGTR
jgi:hypothetical protein